MANRSHVLPSARTFASVKKGTLNMAKRIQMRDETRRAVSDVCGMLLSRYGIVPTFDDVLFMSQAIDREFIAIVDRGNSMTPSQRDTEQKRTPKIVGSDNGD